MSEEFTSSPSASPSAATEEPTLQPTALPTPQPSIPRRPEILGFTGVLIQNFRNELPGVQVKLEQIAPVSTCVYSVPAALSNSQLEFQIVHNIPPFAYPHGDLLASSDFPFELNSSTGSFSGTAPNALSDLLAYPITCIAYEQQANTVGHNLTATFDPSTNDVIVHGDNATVLATCPIFWLGANIIASTFEPNAIVTTFHAVRHSDNVFMTYPDNSEFSTYFGNLIAGAIPFWAITLLCLFLYPSVVCVRLYLRFRKGALCIRLCGDWSWPMFCRCCCGGKRRNSEQSNEPLIKRNRADEYRREIRAILSPQPIRQRLCYLTMGFFVLACVLVVCISSGYGNASELVLGLGHVEQMQHTNTEALQLLGLLNSTFLSARSAAAATANTSYINQLEQAIYSEMLSVAEYAILANAANVRPTQLRDTLFYPPFTIIVEAVVFAGLMLAPVFITWAVILSSCTFRYNEKVKCGGVSRCIGGGLRCYMIVCATACWAIVMMYFYNVALNADMCVYPSIYYMPLTNSTELASTTQPFFESGSIDLYTPTSKQYGFYNANSNNYLFAERNTAKFFYNCNYLEFALGNPFVAAMLRAHSANEASRTLAVENFDSVTVQRLEEAEAGIRSLAKQMQCSTFGQPVVRDMLVNICEVGVVSNFLLFIFLIVIGIVLMVFIPCTNWVHPNMYRQFLANKVFDRVQREREVRIKQTASKNLKFTSEDAAAAAAAAAANGGNGEEGEDGDESKSTSFLRRASNLWQMGKEKKELGPSRRSNVAGEEEEEGERRHGESSGKAVDYTFNADVSRI